MFDNEKVIYENNWYNPIVISEAKIGDGLYLIITRRKDSAGGYYGHVVYTLAYGSHTRHVAIRETIKLGETYNWDSYSYWTKVYIYKHCMEDRSMDYYDRLYLLRRLTGKFIF